MIYFTYLSGATHTRLSYSVLCDTACQSTFHLSYISESYYFDQILSMETSTISDNIKKEELEVAFEGEMNMTYFSNVDLRNETDVSPPPDLAIPIYMSIGVTLSYFLIFFMGVGGNIMVVWIVIRNRDMRSATNVFLLSLSIADLLVLIICMPSALVEFYGKDVWYLGHTMCK